MKILQRQYGELLKNSIVIVAENNRLREAIKKMERLAEILGDDIVDKDILLQALSQIEDIGNRALKGDKK